MALSVANIWKVPELRKKLMITLSILIIYRIGFHIPLPGVNIDVLEARAERTGPLAALFGIMGSLTGANLSGAIWIDGRTRCRRGSIGGCYR